MADRAEVIENAARRVLDAFSALGRAGSIVDSARAYQECEAAMLALGLAVDGDRYTITDKGRAMLKGGE